MHAESGGRRGDRDERESQLKYMSRFHEHEAGQTCIVGGGFNVRGGGDLCLRKEGWRDVWDEGPIDIKSKIESWTWRRSNHTARYDRYYLTTSSDSPVSCVWMATNRSIHPKSTDHVAVQVVLRRTMHGGAATEAKSVDVRFAQRPTDEAPLCGVIAKHTEGRQKESVDTTIQELEVSIVGVANAIYVMDTAFRRRAELCLEGVAVEEWIPEEEKSPKDSPMADWEELPVEGGFKVGKKRPRIERKWVKAGKKKSGALENAKTNKCATTQSTKNGLQSRVGYKRQDGGSA